MKQSHTQPHVARVWSPVQGGLHLSARAQVRLDRGVWSTTPLQRPRPVNIFKGTATDFTKKARSNLKVYMLQRRVGTRLKS